MSKAITSLAFVLFFVFCTGWGLCAEESGFSAGTSVEQQKYGALNVDLDDQGGDEGPKYWRSDASAESAVVSSYDDDPPPYDYAEMGTVRPHYFAEQGESGVKKFLSLSLAEPLDRLASSDAYGVASNVLLKTSSYDGIYADTLVKFTPSVSEPVVDWEADRIVVWMRESEDVDGNVVTNLMVTAGCFAGDYRTVEVRHYTLQPMERPVVAGKWCRLTIRVISDITEYAGGNGRGVAARSPGFTVYLDGEPAIADASYDIGTLSRSDLLSPESRVLISERRLFPGLASAATTKAVTLSRVSFTGLGAVDDVLITTERPAHVHADNVFTLHWDAGVTGIMTCIVSNADVVVTNEIDTAQKPRYRDYSLGTNHCARVTVTNVTYDTAHAYSNGVWTADGDCTVTNNVFLYQGADVNPIGYVTSSRDIISVGGESGCETFAEAFARARAKGGQQAIVLMTNLVPIAITPNESGAKYRDKGYVLVDDGDDFILDLNGFALQGQSANATVYQSGGKLLITDSSDAKTGRVLPSARNRGRMAVESYAGQTSTPVLTIDGGWYDGLVAVTGKVSRKVGDVNCTAICSIDGGSFTNFYGDASHFYLQQYVTNDVSRYYTLVDDYWTTATNGFIWCGEGANARWDNPANWKGGVVPGAGDLAIFPSEESGWKVDFGAGVATTALWLDADIDMSGTNEFSGVKVVPRAGRLVGSGLATFTGRLPGALTGAIGADGEIRLGDGWSGTVKISNIERTGALTAIMGWGNSHSVVEFNGVRGYLSDRSNHALPYALVLTDYITDGGAKTNSAWNNETGYTGSTVSFPSLTGSGTFESPRNLREILQVFQFKRVDGFTGRFKLGGKRLLLGTGSVAGKAKAGHFTFSNKVGVRGGLGWSGVNAHFGTNIVVYGVLKQELMSYNVKESPSVSAVSVTLIDPVTGATNDTCRLNAAGGKITVVSGGTVNYEGQSVMAEDVGDTMRAGSVFEIPQGSAVSIDGNRVIVNGVLVSAFANYYLVRQVDGSTYTVQLDEETVTPTLAEFSVSETDGSVTIKVENAVDGLWYGLQTVSSLSEDWPAPSEWKQPTGDTLTFEPGVTGSARFFRVLVTDRP